MSLQLAAQHLSSRGRGNDSMLVHMSPREVKGLNDLAMAHGGQLSINPSTGLPEAGFLESILPMVVGAALTATGVGAPMAALMVGGGTAVLTGSLKKGLMAGLGAYGGANLGAGLSASGVNAAAASDTAYQAGQTELAKNVADTKFYDPSGALNPAMKDEYVKAQMAASSQSNAARQALQPTSFMDKMQMMGKGISSLGQEGGFSNLYQNLGGSPMSLLKTIGPAVAPLAGELMKPEKQEETKVDADMGQRYGFSMNPTSVQRQTQPGQDPLANTQSPTTTPFPTSQFDSSEKRYFSPQYTKLTPEEAKKLYGYAEGGLANEDRPTETPALQAFKQMQAQRAAQPQTPQYASTPATGGAPAANAPVPTTVEGLYQTYLGRAPDQGGLDFFNKHFGPSVDDGDIDRFKVGEVDRFKMAAAPELAANKRLAEQTGGSLAHEYGEYLRQTRGEPNQLQAPTAPPPTSTNLSDSGVSYDPVKQRYTEIPGTAPATEPAADAFSIDNRPVIGYSSTGEKMYGEVPRRVGMGGMGTMGPSGGQQYAYAAGGGISHLGDYSDGGRLLRGPGDGVSDSIPAMIGKRQPARLADGEFVVPARIVSELGNGSTEAGARKLYAMMDRIQKARGKTVGKNKVAKNSRSEKYLPA